MSRNQLIKSLEQSINLNYDLPNVTLKQLEGHQGGQNLVFYLVSDLEKAFVRLTIRPDRDRNALLEEIRFIRHLHASDVSVAIPIESSDGSFVNSFSFESDSINYVIFEVAKGEQLCDRGYQYIEGKSLSEHHYNCGRLIGQLHNASENYVPHQGMKRHDIVTHMKKLIQNYLPGHLIKVKKKFNELICQLESLDISKETYGLIHGDFGDGNYNIDYDNGKITLFDFDDSGYCWYMYELADAWRASQGWVMFEEDTNKRRIRMEEIFDHILDGYRSVRKLNDSQLKLLPLFLKFVEMEGFLDELRYLTVTEGEVKFDEDLMEQVRNIENDIPYLGLYE
ncbi:phosphotransferase enzyme family protein [Vallitalea guaymasensis]|uniref:Phosphotransferase n=1 Tax=Vallitalea guaymasensis TaxID=1185412 RepID=A0A8J8SCC9_9FIRM|nr:phosphotransferase [Vallitalea guaymasensis]QUH29617.1 phosphotransferase [Vallitalea guaymasensis]